MCYSTCEFLRSYIICDLLVLSVGRFFILSTEILFLKKGVIMNENFDATSKDNVTTGENTDILTELRDMTKRKLILQYISTACIAGMLVVLICAVFVMVPRVSTTLAHINSVAKSAENTLARAEESLAQIDDMALSMEDASGNLNKLVSENGESLASAIKSMTEVDYEGLNKAIKDLQDAIGPMASFMNRFR